jgi:hypothetical protein
MKLNQIGLALLSTLLLSCSDTPTDTTTNFWNRYNTAIYLEAGRSKYMLSSSLGSSDRASATFHNSDSLGLYAGEVTIEGTALLVHDSDFVTRTGDLNTGLAYLAVSGFNPLPLRMNGSTNTFIATGGPNSPAMTVTAASPLREIVVSNPLDKDTVVAGDGVTIRWEASYGDGSAVEIRVYSLSPDAPPGSDLRYPIVADAGSYQISALELESFPAGPFAVSVRRYVRTTGVLADERRYDARIYSQRTVVAELKR